MRSNQPLTGTVARSMQGRPRYAELRDYLQVVRRNRVLIVLLGLLFAGTAYALAARETELYATSTDLAVRDVSQTLSLLGQQNPVAEPPERLAAVVAQDATSIEVATEVAKQLGGRYSAGDLQDKVRARVESSTNLVDIEATDEDPVMSARIANAFAREVARQRREEELGRVRDAQRAVEREVVGARREARRRVPGSDIRLSVALQRLSQLTALEASLRPVEIADVADVPSSPVSPRPLRDTLLGLLLGLTLGLVAAFVRDALDRRVRTAQEVQQELDLPLLGRISNAALGTAALTGAGPPKGRGRRGKSEAIDAEAFRIIRAHLSFLADGEPSRVVLVTSGLPEEGKSTVAAGVAAAAAASGVRALLVECDLRRPTLAGRFGLEPEPGLSDLLAGRASREDVTRRVPVGVQRAVSNGSAPHDAGGPALDVILAGSPHPQPASLLGSDEFAALVGQLRDAYELVVIDTSPTLPVVDAHEIVPLADAIVLCVRAMRTTRDELRAAHESLSHLPSRPTAIVLTGVRPRDDEAYGYGSDYAVAGT